MRRERLPQWAMIASGLIGAALIAVVIFVLARDVAGSAEPAQWRLVPGRMVVPTDTEIPIQVNEIQCASGDSADGRIVESVQYSADTVRFDVSVKRKSGDQDCPSNPVTLYVVELDEAIGERQLIGETSAGEFGS